MQPTVSDIAAIQAAGKKMVAGGEALIGGAKKLAKKLAKKPAAKTKKTKTSKK